MDDCNPSTGKGQVTAYSVVGLWKSYSRYMRNSENFVGESKMNRQQIVLGQ